jgi:hypothetical protein
MFRKELKESWTQYFVLLVVQYLEPPPDYKVPTTVHYVSGTVQSQLSEATSDNQKLG